MKKRFFGVALFALIATNAFADFIWDPLTIGYSNIYFSEKVQVKYSDKYTNPLITGESFTDKASASMNNVGFMPLLAGLGYMPKDKGFYFMWENFLGIGKTKVKHKKLDEEFFDENEKSEHSSSFDYSSTFIFGYAFSPMQDLYVSFGSGLAFGLAAGSDSRPELKNSTSTMTRRKEINAAFVGIPLDVTGRYFFHKHVGILFGLQDTILINIKNDGATSASIHAFDNSSGNSSAGACYANNNKKGSTGNKFTLKLGLTTRW
ncbi:MAG: DUF2715 domain-containing protein [Treponemataceae bacterium]